MDKETVDKLKKLPIKSLTSENLKIPEVFKYAIYFAKTEDEINHLLKNSSTDFLRPFIETMVIKGMIGIENIPTIFLEDRAVALHYAKDDIINMEILPKGYRDNESFVREVAQCNGYVLKYASVRIRNIEDIAISALNVTASAFEFFPERFKNRANCLLALGEKWNTWDFNWKRIPNVFKRDTNFIKEAGFLCSSIYKFLDNDIKSNIEIAEYFLNLDGYNIKYMSEIHRNNKLLMQSVVEKNPSLLKYLGESLKNDVDFILPIVKETPVAIHSCGDGIKSKGEVAKMVCKEKVVPPAINFFNSSIKSDSNIAMLSLTYDPESMSCIDKSLSSDRKFVSEYIENLYFNHEGLKYVSDDLKNDRELMIRAYELKSESLGYVGDLLKRDRIFLNYIFTTRNGNVMKQQLFENLRELDLKVGDEDILLVFCDLVAVDENGLNSRFAILQQISNKTFKDLLESQDDLYKYLKSKSLMNKLEDGLSDKSSVKTKKI